MPRPSLYDILYGNFAGGLDLNTALLNKSNFC